MQIKKQDKVAQLDQEKRKQQTTTSAMSSQRQKKPEQKFLKCFYCFFKW